MLLVQLILLVMGTVALVPSAIHAYELREEFIATTKALLKQPKRMFIAKNCEETSHLMNDPSDYF